MSTPCRPCLAQNCVFPADLELYGLQGPNGPWTWLGLGPNEWRWVTVNCPPGYVCDRGRRVRVFAGSLGTITISTTSSGTPPIVKRLKCCDGTYVVGVFTRNMTEAQIHAVVDRMFAAAAQKQAICNLAAAAGAAGAIIRPPARYKPKTLFLQNTTTEDACLGTPFTASIAVRFSPGGNFPPFTFNQLGGQMPPGLNEQSGASGIYMTIAGRPTTPGNYDFVIEAKDSPPGGQVDSKQYTIYVLGLTNATPDQNGVIRLTGAPMCAQYNEQLTAAGGTAPYTFSIDPVMAPDWISITQWGALVGSPVQSDTGVDFYFDVTVTDADGRSCDQHVVIAVTALTCTTVPAFPNGAINTVYQGGLGYQMVAGFGTGPWTFGWNGGGALPPGIGITTNGLVHGTPTQTGDFAFGINVYDSTGCLCQSGVTMKIVQLGNAGFSVACPGNPNIVAGTAANTYYSAGGPAGADIDNLNSLASVAAFNKLAGLGCPICNIQVASAPRINATTPNPNAATGNTMTADVGCGNYYYVKIGGGINDVDPHAWGNVNFYNNIATTQGQGAPTPGVYQIRTGPGGGGSLMFTLYF